jgi:hypothetical protein
MFEEKKFSDLRNLLDFLYSLDEGFVFRGQSDSSWGLTSTLERLLNGTENFAKIAETTTSDILKSRIHHYFHRDEVPTSELGWLSIAQHHGAPTRLLDFTRFPLFALYFASRHLRKANADFAIWAINFRSLNDDCESLLGTGDKIDKDPDAFFDGCESIKADSPLGAWIGEPRKVNLRLERQGGTFLIPTHPSKTIEESLKESFSRSSVSAFKICVSANLAYEIQHFLAKSGVTASRLFDGVDGLAQEISEDLNRIIHKPV